MKSLTLIASIAASLLLAMPAASSASLKHSVRKAVNVPMPPVKPLILADNVDAGREAQGQARGSNASINPTDSNISQ